MRLVRCGNSIFILRRARGGNNQWSGAATVRRKIGGDDDRRAGIPSAAIRLPEGHQKLNVRADVLALRSLRKSDQLARAVDRIRSEAFRPRLAQSPGAS